MVLHEFSNKNDPATAIPVAMRVIFLLFIVDCLLFNYNKQFTVFVVKYLNPFRIYSSVITLSRATKWISLFPRLTTTGSVSAISRYFFCSFRKSVGLITIIIQKFNYF